MLIIVLINRLYITELVLKGFKQNCNKSVKNICICPANIIWGKINTDLFFFEQIEDVYSVINFIMIQ